ncbi:hypothetical protein C0W35_16485 [Photobacterium kishitanii]|uniref:hypothetical protein n=1 Tax=Photobacterium kishitanii TaxID=318456 RepID=UPI000D17B0F3|nr:hypothetical protein [Photobacterium kishitanii]PSU90479.1 hypothetical protein C0W35_16485 [Photobacterium kishitanii]
MYNKTVTCAIKGDIHHKLIFTINPTGYLIVEIKHKNYKANFNDLFFFNHEKTTDLVCIEDGTIMHLCWNLLIYKNDATKLNVAIDNAINEYEVIMRDL